MSRMGDFIAPSWSPLGRSWRSFRLIFSLSLLASICHRFFSDFGVVLGGLWEAKILDFRIFFDVFLKSFLKRVWEGEKIAKHEPTRSTKQKFWVGLR